MRKLIAAVAILFLTMLGVPARATNMLAVLNGDFNDDPFWNSWTITINYNTADGLVTPIGGPFPGLQFNGAATHVHGVVNNQTSPGPYCPNPCVLPSAPAVFDLDNAVLTIAHTADSYLFGFSGGGLSASGLGFDFRNACSFQPAAPYCAPDPSVGVGPLDGPFLRTVDDDYGSWNLTSIGVLNSMPHNHGAQAVVPLAIPEPGTWAMLILGWMAIGLALRVRPVRRVPENA